MEKLTVAQSTIVPKVLYYLIATPTEVSVLETAEEVGELLSEAKEGDFFAGGVYEASVALKMQRYLLTRDHNVVGLNTGYYLAPDLQTGPNRTIRPTYSNKINFPVARSLSLIGQ